MNDPIFVTLVLAAATFTIRLGGVYLGQSLPTGGAWARGLNALPGCLIVALVSVSVLTGEPQEWLAALIAVAVAMLTRSLPLTMAAGILAIFVLRQMS